MTFPGVTNQGSDVEFFVDSQNLAKSRKSTGVALICLQREVRLVLVPRRKSVSKFLCLFVYNLGSVIPANSPRKWWSCNGFGALRACHLRGDLHDCRGRCRRTAKCLRVSPKVSLWDVRWLTVRECQCVRIPDERERFRIPVSASLSRLAPKAE